MRLALRSGQVARAGSGEGYHPRVFGAHLSVAGGLDKALEEARRLRLDCVQVFTRNQRQWAARALEQPEVQAWTRALRRLGWTARRCVSHASYLINLASPDPPQRRRSVAALRGELERCEALGIGCCVLHPGAHMGEPAPPGATRPTRDERAGLNRVAHKIDRLHRELPGFKVVLCLETTAGSGTTLGYAFTHLDWVRQRLREPQRLGYCFDTCHVTAAGYDMSSDAAAASVLNEFDEVCGLRHLRVLHLNDSAAPAGSRRDRHAHIGQGTCGLACFRAIVNYPAFARVPKIIETPKGLDERGIPWDVVNIRKLRRLARRATHTAR